jgi:hypothetical protein
VHHKKEREKATEKGRKEGRSEEEMHTTEKQRVLGTLNPNNNTLTGSIVCNLYIQCYVNQLQLNCFLI